MARIARVVYPGVAHHITQRGIRHLDIFIDDDDRRFFIKLLQKYSKKYQLKIHAYCLMSNHIHLVAVPEKPQSMQNTMHDLCTRYAAYFNRKYNFSGHLFQNRYFSTPLEGEHSENAARYVEQNPAHAGMVARADIFPWSSARGNCGITEDKLLDSESPILKDPENWRVALAENLDNVIIKKIQKATESGKPLGSDKFIKELETKLKRKIKSQKRGRPRRNLLIK